MDAETSSSESPDTTLDRLIKREQNKLDIAETVEASTQEVANKMVTTLGTMLVS